MEVRETRTQEAAPMGGERGGDGARAIWAGPCESPVSFLGSDLQAIQVLPGLVLPHTGPPAAYLPGEDVSVALMNPAQS